MVWVWHLSALCNVDRTPFPTTGPGLCLPGPQHHFHEVLGMGPRGAAKGTPAIEDGQTSTPGAAHLHPL